MYGWKIFADCASFAWSPGVGDPDLLGVVLTLLYATATFLVAVVAFRGKAVGPEAKRERWLWGIAAAVLLVLTLNKQLDLQNFITATGRCMSREQGWYGLRRAYQREVVMALLLFGAAVTATSVLVFRRILGRNGMLVLGMAGLMVFVLIRAVSFNHMELLLGDRLAAARSYRLIETVALLLVVAAGTTRLFGRRDPDDRPKIGQDGQA